MFKIKPLLFILAIITFVSAGCSLKKPTSATRTPIGQSTLSNIQKTYSMAEVQDSNTTDKCWTVILGNIYNMI